MPEGKECLLYEGRLAKGCKRGDLLLQRVDNDLEHLKWHQEIGISCSCSFPMQAGRLKRN